jgi:hypothetical protein
MAWWWKTDSTGQKRNMLTTHHNVIRFWVLKLKTIPFVAIITFQDISDAQLFVIILLKKIFQSGTV